MSENRFHEDRKNWGSYQREHAVNERLGVRPHDVVWMCPNNGGSVFDREGEPRAPEHCEFAVTEADFWSGDDAKLAHECPWHPEKPRC